MTPVNKPVLGSWIDLASVGHPATWYRSVAQAKYQGVFLDIQTPGWATDYHYALQAGVAVMLFQGYWGPAWSQSSMATQRAAYAVQQLKAVGYPTTDVVWLDAEEMGSLSSTAALSWINAWNDELLKAGYTELGVYVGAGCPMSGTEWYQGLSKTTHYWRSASHVPTVATRGYQVIQTAVNHTVGGVTVDLDTVQADSLHATPNAIHWPSSAITVSTTTDWKPYIDALQTQVKALQSNHDTLTKQVSSLHGQLQQAAKVLGS